MTSEHDKLLSEGPRMAAEPPTAEGVATPTPADTAAQPPVLKPRPQGPGPQGSWLTASVLRRLIPLLLVLVLLGRGFAGGRSGSWAFAPVWVVAAVVIVFVRMRGRRRR